MGPGLTGDGQAAKRDDRWGEHMPTERNRAKNTPGAAISSLVGPVVGSGSPAGLESVAEGGGSPRDHAAWAGRPELSDFLDTQVFQASHDDYFKLPAAPVNAINELIQARKELERGRVRLAGLMSFKDSILNTSAVGIFVVSAQRVIVEVNTSGAKLFGYSPEEMIGQPARIAHIDDEAAREFGVRLWGLGAWRQNISINWRMRRKNGEIFWCELAGSAINGRDTGQGVVWVAFDITARKETETAQRNVAELMRALVDHSPDIIIRYDRQLRRLYVNPAASRLIGKPAEKLLGQAIDNEPFSEGVGYKATLREVFDTGRAAELEVRYRSPRGEVVWGVTRFEPESAPDNRVASVLAISRDITDLVRHREQLQWLTDYDPLTGLPNRAFFRDHARREAAKSQSDEEKLVLMILDIDNFKEVNDTLGLAVGDQALCEIARRIKKHSLEYGLLARLGGDNFALLSRGGHSRQDAEAMARSILVAFAKPLRVGTLEVRVTPSIGIAVYPDDTRQLEILCQFADAAMRHAKNKGRNTFRFHEPRLTQATTARLSLKCQLDHALERGQFELYYQPKVRLPGGDLLGAEALLRWSHPELGLLSPDRFIGLAEETGLIVEIGAWVLMEACATIARWNRTRAVPVRVAVNLSGRQFIRNDLAGTVANALSTHGCRGSWLELEITESLALGDNPDIKRTLESLSALGASIAIDDFGTGHSALCYLNRFKLDVLKIDRSFVSGLEHDQRKGELVKAFVAVARAFCMDVVAEGVELPEQVEFLCANGCHVGQGYLFGRPMPEAEFERLLGHSG